MGDGCAAGSDIPVMVALLVLVFVVGGGGMVVYGRRLECWIKCARRGSGRKRRGVGMGIEIGMRMLVMGLGLDGRGQIIGLVAGVVCECWACRIRLRECVRRQRLRVLLQAWVNWVVAHGVWMVRARRWVGGVNVPSSWTLRAAFLQGVAWRRHRLRHKEMAGWARHATISGHAALIC
jgi:hypothetical protein